MLKKILIFRTDRIGDLIVNCPAILTIKNYFDNAEITFVGSEKNVNYAKSLNIFHSIYTFPKKNLFKKINLIRLLQKKDFDYIFIFDGKERSIISSLFINSKIKVALSQRMKIYYKFSKIKFFKDQENTSLNDIFNNMMIYCNIKTRIKNYDYISKKKDNNFSKEISVNNYIHVHLDEKWFTNLYIKSYTDINPTYDDFIKFINSISDSENVLITTGIMDSAMIEKLKNNFFKKLDDKLFEKKNNNYSIFFVYKPSFEDIESLLKNSKTLIACHGAITHAASSFNIKIIDIIEKNMQSFYKRFTSHINNYTFVAREDFNSLKKKLYSKLIV